MDPASPPSRPSSQSSLPVLARVFLAAGSANKADQLRVWAGALSLGQGSPAHLSGLTHIAATEGFVGTGIVAA